MVIGKTFGNIAFGAAICWNDDQLYLGNFFFRLTMIWAPLVCCVSVARYGSMFARFRIAKQNSEAVYVSSVCSRILKNNRMFEYGLQAKPSILHRAIVFFAAARDDNDNSYRYCRIMSRIIRNKFAA